MKKNKKSKLRIFKYNAILSMIFFLTSTFYFGKKIQNYNIKEYTLSALSKFLNQENLTYFNATFFIKSFMDLLFVLYVFKHYKINIFSIIGVSWIMAVLSFGALGFFPSSKYELIHMIIVGILFLSFSSSEYFLAKITKDKKFIYLTNNLLIIQITSILLFFITNNFNGVFEIFYMMTAFLWLLIFIKNYL